MNGEQESGKTSAADWNGGNKGFRFSDCLIYLVHEYNMWMLCGCYDSCYMVPVNNHPISNVCIRYLTTKCIPGRREAMYIYKE